MEHARKIGPEQEAQILQMHVAGKTAGEIASLFGVHRNTVGHVLWRAGLTQKKPGRRRLLTDEQLQLISRLYEEGNTQEQIGKVMQVNPTTIARYLQEAGVPTRPAGFQRGEAHHAWKGGRIETDGGYVLVLQRPEDPFYAMAQIKDGDSRYVLEHRLVMAQHLGRMLTEEETVHHKNGDHANNALDNLQLRQGRHGKGVVLRCLACGSCNIGASSLA